MKVIILSGLPGSGKSTWARKMFPGAVIVSADDHFMVDGEYRFDPTQLPQAHGLCLQHFVSAVSTEGQALLAKSWDRDETAQALWNDRTVIVDNTNTLIAEIAPYAALAQAYGHELEIVTISCDAAKAHARNSHGVDAFTVGMMAQRLRDLVLPPWWPQRKVVAE